MQKSSGTWRRKAGLATWTFSADSVEGRAPQAQLTSMLDGVVAALEGFGRPTRASWTSESQGEEAAVQVIGEQPRSTLAAAPVSDPEQVTLDLALEVTTESGDVASIANGADLWVELEDEGVAVVLSLDVDLYAWRSLGAQRDNQAMARLNAPRLARFLQRLEALGLRLEDIDAGDYPGQVGPTGFCRPE